MPQGGVPVPFAPREIYTPDRSIAQMILQAGQQRAAMQQQMYGGLADTVSQLGQIPQQIARTKAIEAETKRQEAMAQRAEAQAKREEEAVKARAEEAARKQQQDAQFMQLLQKGKPDPAAVMGIYGPERGSNVLKGLEAYEAMGQKRGKAALEDLPAVIRGFTAVGDTAKAGMWPHVRQQVVDAQLFSPEHLPKQYNPELNPLIETIGKSLEKPKEPKLYSETVQGPTGPVAKLFTEDELRKGVPTYVKPEKPEKEPVAKPLLGGEVNKINQLDTSLKEAQVLKESVVSGGGTGAGSALGAMLPNVVTEFTGWGSDAKKRQGVIERVKQIIGKGLEEGVLRKEDEIKYAKILPTISDPPDVAQSKIDGLITTLQNNREITLENYKAAGRNVDQFKRETPKTPESGQTRVGPDGKTYRKVQGGWQQVNQ